MDDLANYRSRIGTFFQSNYAKKVFKIYTKTKGRFAFTYSLSLLVVLSLAAHCLKQDPSIEQNPGPNFQSEKEKSLFYAIRKFNKKIADICSHRYFLTKCL